MWGGPCPWQTTQGMQLPNDTNHSDERFHRHKKHTNLPPENRKDGHANSK